MTANGSGRTLLIRHAQASAGAADYDALSGNGLEQAKRLGVWLAAREDESFVNVVSGTLRRHAQTLNEIQTAFAAAGRTLPIPICDPDWNEFDHQGVIRAYAQTHPDDPNIAALQTLSDVRAIYALLVTAMGAWRVGRLDDAVGESWAQFGERVERARASLDGVSGPLLVISSGGVIARCAQAALGIDDERTLELNLSLRNSGQCEFRRRPERWHMLGWNGLPHLAQPDDRHLTSYY